MIQEQKTWEGEGLLRGPTFLSDGQSIAVNSLGPSMYQHQHSSIRGFSLSNINIRQFAGDVHAAAQIAIELKVLSRSRFAIDAYVHLPSYFSRHISSPSDAPSDLVSCVLAMCTPTMLISNDCMPLERKARGLLIPTSIARRGLPPSRGNLLPLLCRAGDRCASC